MNRVPFSLPDVGLRELRGMAFVEDDFLVLRLESAILGLVDTEKNVFKIEPGALESIRAQRGVFRDRLVIKPKGPELLDLVPGEHTSVLGLRVRRKHRGDLEGLVEEVRRLIWLKSNVDTD